MISGRKFIPSSSTHNGRKVLAETSSDILSFQEDETIEFLSQCGDEHFLDFTELILQYEAFWELEVDPSLLIDAVNEFFKADHLPYSLTDFVHVQDSIDVYPQIIRRDSEVLHETAIQPALALLANPVFASANREFLDALKDDRDGDSGDCVAKVRKFPRERDEDNLRTEGMVI